MDNVNDWRLARCWLCCRAFLEDRTPENSEPPKSPAGQRTGADHGEDVLAADGGFASSAAAREGDSAATKRIVRASSFRWKSGLRPPRSAAGRPIERSHARGGPFGMTRGQNSAGPLAGPGVAPKTGFQGPANPRDSRKGADPSLTRRPSPPMMPIVERQRTATDAC